MCGGARRTRAPSCFGLLHLSFVASVRSCVRLTTKRQSPCNAVICGYPAKAFAMFHKRPFLAHNERAPGATLATRDNDGAKPCFITNDAKLSDLAGYETCPARGVLAGARPGNMPRAEHRSRRSEMSGEKRPGPAREALSDPEKTCRPATGGPEATVNERTPPGPRPRCRRRMPAPRAALAGRAPGTG